MNRIDFMNKMCRYISFVLIIKDLRTIVIDSILLYILYERIFF